MACDSLLFESLTAFWEEMRRLKHPSRRTHKHRLINLSPTTTNATHQYPSLPSRPKLEQQVRTHLHAPIIILPIQRRNLTPIPPILQGIEITRGDTRAAGIDTAEVEQGVFDEGVERGGEEGGDGGFGDVDEDVGGFGYF